MPFLLVEIFNFQGSTHLIGVGSLSYSLYCLHTKAFSGYTNTWKGFIIQKTKNKVVHLGEEIVMNFLLQKADEESLKLQVDVSKGE
jgi:hypothetical protein